MSDTLSELRRLHADVKRRHDAIAGIARGDAIPFYEKMDVETAERAFAALAFSNMPKLLACAEALEYLTADVEAAHVSGALNSPPPTEHEHANLARARAALAALKGAA